MPSKLSNILAKIELIPNPTSKEIIKAFSHYLIVADKSENNQRNLLQVVTNFAIHLGTTKSLDEITQSQDITDYLMAIKMKNDITKKEKNQYDLNDEKWKTTWNDYFERLNYFFRWYFSCHKKGEFIDEENWDTPEFMKIKKKKINKENKYDSIEIWSKEELLSIIEYEDDIRNKAIITLLWDLNARNHEVVRMKIKNVVFKDRYAEGEIPYYTKTGSREVLLRASFPYVRDWLNLHPLKNQINASLVCSHTTGKELHPDTLWAIMNNLKKKILEILENKLIEDIEKKKLLSYLISSKKCNPYCIRHSSIDEDAEWLVDNSMTKKVGWTINTKRRGTYIQKRMGRKTKMEVLKRDGIIIDDFDRTVPSIKICSRCEYTNGFDADVCKCGYPLSKTAYDKIKAEEQVKFNDIEARLKIEMESKIKNIIEKKVGELKLDNENKNSEYIEWLMEHHKFQVDGIKRKPYHIPKEKILENIVNDNEYKNLSDEELNLVKERIEKINPITSWEPIAKEINNKNNKNEKDQDLSYMEFENEFFLS
jgi:integrase